MSRSALLNELLEAKITAVVRTKTAEQAVQDRTCAVCCWYSAG